MRRPDKKITFYTDDFCSITYRELRVFSKLVIQELCENEDGVKLPGRHGIVRIEGDKRKALNRLETKKLGYPVFHQNYDTDGYMFTIKWKHYLTGYTKKKQSEIRKDFYYNCFTLKGYDVLKDKMFEFISKDLWTEWYRVQEKFKPHYNNEN